VALVLSMAVGARSLEGQESPPPADPVAQGRGAAAAAVTALRTQKFTDCLRIVDEALVPLEAAKEEADHDVRSRLALNLLILKGQALYGLGRPQEVIESLERFIPASDAAAALVSPAADWNALTVLADSLMALDRWNDALAALTRAHSLLAADTTAEPRALAVNRATTLGKIGTVRSRLGDWKGARDAFGEQVVALAAEPDGGGPYLAAAHNGLGLVADNLGDHATAAKHYATAAEIYEKAFGLDHPYTKRALVTLGRVNSLLGNSSEADAIAARLATVDAVPSSISPTLQPNPADPGQPPTPPGKPALAPIGWPVVAAAGAALLLGLMALTGAFRRGSGGEDQDAEEPDPRRGDDAGSADDTTPR